MSLIAELQRRKVIRVGVAYAVVAFVVLQVAQLLADGLDLPGWVFRSITLLTLVGFPIALVMAWALELTPDGIRKAQLTDSTQASIISDRASWRAAVLGLAAIALMVAAGWWHLASSPTVYDSVAVLPFTNLSADKDGDYLGDGLAEELLNALSNVPALQVAARTSAFSFKGRDVDVRSIGEQLGVASVLEGSVRRDGDRVRVAAQLVDASTGFRIWRGDYERNTVDLFALQNLIAGEIAQALAVELGAANVEQLATGGTENGEAYELYLRARQRWASREMPELREALNEMRAAVELDPEFALAWSGVSDVIDALAWRSSDYLPLIPEGKAAAMRALALAPDLPEAWASLGIIIGEFDFEWQTANMLISQAIALRPSYAQAHQWRADIQRYLGRVDEGLESFAIVERLDPLSNFFKQNHANQLVRYGSADDGLRMMREVIAEWPEHRNTLGYLAFGPQLSLAAEERSDFVERWAASIGYSEPARARVLIDAIYNTDRLPEALAVLADIEEECGWVEPLPIYAAAIGNADLTLSILERGSVTNMVSIAGIGTDPTYRFIADDPRFLALLEMQRLPLDMPD